MRGAKPSAYRSRTSTVRPSFSSRTRARSAMWAVREPARWWATTSSAVAMGSSFQGSEADERLAGVGAAQVAEERGRGPVEAVEDGLLGAQGAVGEPARGLGDVLGEQVQVRADLHAAQ